MDKDFDVDMFLHYLLCSAAVVRINFSELWDQYTFCSLSSSNCNPIGFGMHLFAIAVFMLMKN